MIKRQFAFNKKSKDAGFVYESLRIDTKQTFLTFFLTKRIHKTNLLKIASRNESTKRIFWKLRHETNPQNESFEHCGTKRIHETNLLNTVGIRESGSTGFVWIRMSIVLRIREDSLDLSDSSNLLKIASRNESAKPIFWKWLDSWSTIRNVSFQVRICDPRYKTNPGFVVTIRYESMDSQNESTFLRISYTIPASLKKSHEEILLLYYTRCVS